MDTLAGNSDDGLLAASKTQLEGEKLRLFDRSTVQLLLHSLGNAIVIVLIFGVAVGLDTLDHQCKVLQLSPWLCAGFDYVARGAYWTDCALLGATVFINGAHLITVTFGRAFGRRKGL